MTFTELKDSFNRNETWTKQPTIPAPSVAKVGEALGLHAKYGIMAFSLTEKVRIRISPEHPFSATKIPKFHDEPL